VIAAPTNDPPEPVKPIVSVVGARPDVVDEAIGGHRNDAADIPLAPSAGAARSCLRHVGSRYALAIDVGARVVIVQPEPPLAHWRFAKAVPLTITVDGLET